MGELSKPFMTPVGVLYRSFHDTEAHALKAAEWAVKLFGGKTTAYNVIGPNKKGLYESGILFTVPADAEWAKPPRKDPDKSWWSEPTHAYVFFDSLETPAALFFYKQDLIIKPGRQPPFIAQISLDLA
jgi:hypothetical protein